MYSHTVLTALLVWPVVGAAVVLLVPERWAKHVALAASLAEFAISVPLWWTFQPAAGMQFVLDLPWIPFWGIRYTVGVDGISLFMVLLTTFLVPLSVLGSYTYIATRERGFYALARRDVRVAAQDRQRDQERREQHHEQRDAVHADRVADAPEGDPRQVQHELHPGSGLEGPPQWHRDRELGEARGQGHVLRPALGHEQYDRGADHGPDEERGEHRVRVHASAPLRPLRRSRRPRTAPRTHPPLPSATGSPPIPRRATRPPSRSRAVRPPPARPRPSTAPRATTTSPAGRRWRRTAHRRTTSSRAADPAPAPGARGGPGPASPV